MRIGISNLAWDPVQDSLVSDLLGVCRIACIDIAPGKYFPDLQNASDTEILAVGEFWKAFGIDIVGMQALLFGTHGLNLFGSSASQAAMLQHLAGVARVGRILNAKRLTFGSPRNRDRKGLSDEAARRQSVDFFCRLGDIAVQEGVLFCLEPNPPCYQCNFMTNSLDTLAIVKACNHPGIRMQLDLGAMIVNGEDFFDIIAAIAPYTSHVHLSEPNLVPIGSTDVDHVSFASAIRKYLSDSVLTIEMLTPATEDRLSILRRSIEFAVSVYCNERTIDFACV